jgi:hypothetical protein
MVVSDLRPLRGTTSPATRPRAMTKAPVMAHLLKLFVPPG